MPLDRQLLRGHVDKCANINLVLVKKKNDDYCNYIYYSCTHNYGRKQYDAGL